MILSFCQKKAVYWCIFVFSHRICYPLEGTSFSRNKRQYQCHYPDLNPNMLSRFFSHRLQLNEWRLWSLDRKRLWPGFIFPLFLHKCCSSYQQSFRAKWLIYLFQGNLDVMGRALYRSLSLSFWHKLCFGCQKLYGIMAKIYCKLLICFFPKSLQCKILSRIHSCWTPQCFECLWQQYAFLPRNLSWSQHHCWQDIFFGPCQAGSRLQKSKVSFSVGEV